LVITDPSQGPGTSDVTDGSCPLVHLGAVLDEVHRMLKSHGIESTNDMFGVDGEELWAVVVGDWQHFSAAVAAVAEVLGTYGIGAKMAVAVEGTECVELL